MHGPNLVFGARIVRDDDMWLNDWRYNVIALCGDIYAGICDMVRLGGGKKLGFSLLGRRGANTK